MTRPALTLARWRPFLGGNAPPETFRTLHPAAPRVGLLMLPFVATPPLALVIRFPYDHHGLHACRSRLGPMSG